MVVEDRDFPMGEQHCCIAIQQYTPTHSILTAVFPGEPGLVGCPVNSFLHLFVNCATFWDRPKLSMSSLTQSHQVFFGHPLCLIPSAFHSIEHLTQSLLSLCSTCPDYLNQLFLIIKLTGSNFYSCLTSSLFFLASSLTPHIHLIILISV